MSSAGDTVVYTLYRAVPARLARRARSDPRTAHDKLQTMGEELEIQEIWSRLGLATKSPRLLSMLHEAEMPAIADCAVLVQGETGTGNELLAREIHERSGRQGRLVPVNVGAITPDLF